MLFWEEQGNRAVRQGKWKLVWDVNVGRWELYDLEADRTEMNDLAEKNPGKIKELASAYELWDKTTGRTAGSAAKPRANPPKQSQPK